ncbi:MAG: nicotinate-nucleotide adenylyltransferase [Actinomycetota bacterium]
MSNGSGRRIGVFGGTFDPPHVGHLATALEVRHALALDEVWFVVAGDPWQKSSDRAITPAPIRLAMVAAAIDGADGCLVSTIETDRDGPSYMVDTLAVLTRDHADDTFHLIVGSDAAAGLDSWHRPDALAELARIVVVDRGGREGGRPPEGRSFALVDVPALEVSSSDLRRRVADGAPVRGLVAAAVADLIEAHQLYREPV